MPPPEDPRLLGLALGAGLFLSLLTGVALRLRAWWRRAAGNETILREEHDE
jgi:hypothetical protein